MKRRLLQSTILAASVAAATQAFAQTAPADGRSPTAAQASQGRSAAQQLDEIVVTATKRVEPVQKVPETVNVVSASLISELHVQNTIELSKVVGGLSLT